MENIQRKDQVLENDWATVKARKKVIQSNVRSIIDICQEFDKLDDNSQENELIDYICELIDYKL